VSDMIETEIRFICSFAACWFYSII